MSDWAADHSPGSVSSHSAAVDIAASANRARGSLFWLTPFVYGLAKPVVISSSLIPRLHWWSGNSPNGILSIR